MYRQGDVLLIPIKELPKGLKEKDKILAYGEATGHKHQFIEATAKVFDNGTGQQYVMLKQKSVLQHEEHSSITIPKGEYKVVLQREQDIVEGVRQVMD